MNWFSHLSYRIKMLKQRVSWGFDDKEVFSLDYNLTKHIIPRLKRLKEKREYMGFDNDDMLESINKMIIAFEIYDKCGGDMYTVSDEDKAKHKEGMHCFAEDYGGLWY